MTKKKPREMDEGEFKTISYAQGLASKIAGGIVGSAVGLITVNPVLGATVGAGLAHTLETVGREVIGRHLAPRQELRVGRAIAIAYGKMRELEAAGRMIRTDDFFDPDGSGRSPGDEVTEAALQAAMDSAEEKKVDFIATLLANIATDPAIDAGTAHVLLDQAERIPYRSFILLRICAEVDSYNFADRHAHADPGFGRDAITQALELEAYQLLQAGLVVIKQHAIGDSTVAVFGPDDVNPCWMRLTGLGELLHDSLGLEQMEKDGQFEKVVEGLEELVVSGRGERTISNAIMDGGPF